VHIRIKPVLQEGIKPTIVKGQEVRPVINQGTKTAQTIFKGTKVEKEVNAGVKGRESIIRNSVLPTDNKGVIVKKEIISTNTVGMGGAGASAGLGLEGMQVSQIITAEGVHKEIVAGTTVRQSVVRSSVLPTIDGGTKILKPIFGGVRQSSVGAGAGVELNLGASAAGAGLGLESGSAGFGTGVSSTQIGATTSTTTTHDVIDLGTTVHNTIDLGVVNTGTTQINSGAIGTSGLILGENAGTAGLVNNSSQIGTGSSGLAFSSSQIGTTQVQGMDSNGMIMGLGGEGDNAIDVSYSTNTNKNAGLSTFGAASSTQYGTTGPTTTTTTKTVKYTTTTGPTVMGTSNILNPIVKTTVKEPIITGSTMNIQTNNSTL
jgi:hypothetical protein